jgi:hypothetical protein
MSFSIDLWDGFDLIKNKFNSTYTKVQILYNLINTFINMEKEYSKGLDNLYKECKDRIKEDFLLEQSFIQLIDNIKNQSDYHKKHIDFISKYLAGPLKEKLDEQKSISQLFAENAKDEENFGKSKNNIIAKEEKYHNSCIDLINFLITIDSTLINSTLSNNKQLFFKRQKLLDKIYDSKRDYISTLFESNIDLDQYNIKTNQILNDLENKYLSIIDLLKWTLINYANNKIVLYEKTNSLYKAMLQKYFTNINCNEEVLKFIKKNITKEFPLSKFEFIPYKLNSINLHLFKDSEKKQNLNECNRRINEIKKFFTENKLISNNLKDYDIDSNNKFEIITSSLKKLITIEKEAFKKPASKKKIRNISQELNYNSMNNINNKFVLKERENQMKSNLTYIEFFVDKLMLKKNETKRQEIEKFKSIFLLNKNENCIYFDIFIKTINDYRAKGKYFLCHNTYDILVEIFSFMLDNFEENDNLLKNILILSQTFCVLKPLTNDRIYIQKGIKNHNIFNSFKLWHRVINYTLGLSIYNRDIAQKNDKQENQRKLTILALNTLIAYLCDLKCFTDDKKVYDEVKKFYCEIYQLNEKDVDNSVQISHEEMNISRTITIHEK